MMMILALLHIIGLFGVWRLWSHHCIMRIVMNFWIKVVLLQILRLILVKMFMILNRFLLLWRRLGLCQRLDRVQNCRCVLFNVFYFIFTTGLIWFELVLVWLSKTWFSTSRNNIFFLCTTINQSQINFFKINVIKIKYS
jgi:hypothetical protein